MFRCKGATNAVDAIDKEDKSEERSSFVDALGTGCETDCWFDGSSTEDSSRATAAATPNRTARSRSGRSKMCEELGWRIYLC